MWWPVVPHHWNYCISLFYPFSTVIQNQTPCSQTHHAIVSTNVNALQSMQEPMWALYNTYLRLLPGLVGTVVYTQIVIHGMRLLCAEKVTGYCACCIYALVALTTQVPCIYC